MRIRKRQAGVAVPPRPTISALNGSGNEEEHLVGQNSCTCCSRQRRLQNWELRNRLDRESDEPSNGFAGGTSVADKNQVSLSETRTMDYVWTETQLSETEKFRGPSGNTPTKDLDNSEVRSIYEGSADLKYLSLEENLGAPRLRDTFDGHLKMKREVQKIIDAEEKESNAAATLERLGGYERFRGNENSSKATSGRAPVYVSEQLRNSEVDVNHPGNKPKESLLYSLYCVFSELSGKAVLTAREALSRIMEERLPGLDEETGLPSLQVAKVMRSNPYFVHLEGGKFFLCSAPSSDSKEDLDSGDVLDNEHTPSSTSPTFRPKIGTLNSSRRAEGPKEQQQQLFSNTDVSRTKRARSKEVATIDGAFDKTEYRSRGSKREGQKALKPPNSVSEQDKYGADPVEPICKRYDGRGWKCHEKALPGYSMCRHHHELIVNRLARLRNSGRLGSKKSSKRRKTSAKPSKEVLDVINEGEVSVNNNQSGAHWWKNVKARSLKSINN